MRKCQNSTKRAFEGQAIRQEIQARSRSRSAVDAGEGAAQHHRVGDVELVLLCGRQSGAAAAPCDGVGEDPDALRELELLDPVYTDEPRKDLFGG
jgi:hypothetical protein